jgi:hypothetical protein
MDQLRAVRPLPGTRRNLFHQGTRRQNPTSVRPDTANIFQQPMDEELVERTPTGEYALYAPQTTYKHMALGLGGGQEVDEEIGIYIHFRKGGQVRANLCDRAREANDRAVWAAACSLGRRGGRDGNQGCDQVKFAAKSGELGGGQVDVSG